MLFEHDSFRCRYGCYRCCVEGGRAERNGIITGFEHGFGWRFVVGGQLAQWERKRHETRLSRCELGCLRECDEPDAFLAKGAFGATRVCLYDVLAGESGARVLDSNRQLHGRAFERHRFELLRERCVAQAVSERIGGFHAEACVVAISDVDAFLVICAIEVVGQKAKLRGVGHLCKRLGP